MQLVAEHALVTGSSRGIGRGIAVKLAEHGVKVGVHFHTNETAAKETLAAVQAAGSDGFVVQADVSRPDEVKAMLARTAREFGSLDIFVANARCEPPTFYRALPDLEVEHWDMASDTQGKAFLVGAREAAALMRPGGRIIAITHAPGARTGSWRPWVGMGSAKAALEALVRYFAVELAPSGITVNTLSPGLTDDSVLNGFPEEVQQAVAGWHETGWTPMRRLGTPADIGNAVVVLCAEEAGWITGQMIYADGGASLMDPSFPLEIQQ